MNKTEQRQPANTRLKVARLFTERPLSTAIIYVGASAVWILVTDKALAWLDVGNVLRPSLSIAKGFFYLLVTGALIYGVLRKAHNVNQNLESIVHERTDSLVRQEIEIRRRADIFRTLLDGVPAGIAMLDRRMCYVEVSDRFCSEYGLVRNQIIGKCHYDVFPEIPERWKEAHQKGLWGEVVREDSDKFVDSNGKEHHIRWSIRPWGDSGETSGGIIIYTENISEQYSMQLKFLQAQRMEAVGRLAGGIAHDFNNLLMVIGSSAELLRDTDDLGRRQKYLSNIQNSVGKAARLTSQLLAFSRQQVMQPSVLDLNDIVRDLSKLVVPLLGEDIDVKMELAQDLGRVEADRGQLEQVIMNLAVNARDAMPSGGCLTVSTTNLTVDASASPNRSFSITPGQYVLLRISDTGIGMPPEVQNRVFEPFFTTKDFGKGTGLGLATVYGIIKQSGGWIWVSSEVGKGTLFSVCLPRVEKGLELSDERIPLVTATGSERILLVEDEDSVRRPVAEYLSAKGYEVLEAVDGQNAIEISTKGMGRISVLITDLVMPGVDGLRLAEKLLAKRPEMRVILVSGYTDRMQSIHQANIPLEYLQKPFSLDLLARTLRKVLDAQSTSSK